MSECTAAPLICHFCAQPIEAGLVNHHLVPVADGGDVAGQTVPCHRECHNQWHRDNGDYARWHTAKLQERIAMFGADEVRRLLAFWGRQGWQQLVATRGPAYLAEFHRRGGLARAANGRDARGRFVAAGTAAEDPDHLREAF